MSGASKDNYTLAQKRKTAAIKTTAERGVPPDEARARAWATLNKQSGGGKRVGGSGRTTTLKKTSRTE